MRILAVAALLAASTPALAQTPAAEPPAPAAAAPSPPAEPAHVWRTLDPANTLILDTTKGRVVLELRPDLAPLTVARIKALARQGYYNGSLFYRVIAGFMAQTSDKGDKQFRSKLPNLKNLDPSVQKQLAVMDPGNDYMVNWLWGFTTVGINVDKVKAAIAPKPRLPTTVIAAPLEAWGLPDRFLAPLELLRHMTERLVPGQRLGINRHDGIAQVQHRAASQQMQRLQRHGARTVNGWIVVTSIGSND